jgi:iron complex transport system permease protein
MSLSKQIILVLFPIVCFFLSLFLGRYAVDPATLVQVLLSKLLFFIPIEQTWSDTVEVVLFRIRFPRALMALMVGAGLSISGASFQGMFHNPLVSPYLLGVSSGAGFGAAIALMMNLPALAVQALAICFGIVAVLVTYAISRVSQTTPKLMLVLSGVVVSSLFMALISLVKYTADPYDKLPAIVFWLMGSLGSTRFADVLMTAPIMGLGMVGLLLLRWRINLLSMGEREARAMGVNAELLKKIIIVSSTLIAAAAVSVCGIVGWVGLVIPHICRMWVGPDHRVLLPATLSIGAAYLLLIDDLARTLVQAEIPLGVLTAILGAPFFAFLLRRSQGGWM